MGEERFLILDEWHEEDDSPNVVVVSDEDAGPVVLQRGDDEADASAFTRPATKKKQKDAFASTRPASKKKTREDEDTRPWAL